MPGWADIALPTGPPLEQHRTTSKLQRRGITLPLHRSSGRAPSGWSRHGAAFRFLGGETIAFRHRLR